MLELIILGLFSAVLLGCILLGHAIVYALLIGYALFLSYGLVRKFPLVQLLHMSLNGVKKVAGILFVFVLIGMITAIWRDCGTIPFIIDHASGFIAPSVFVLITFLLCCLISALTGTAFGTSATVGVICMTLGGAMGMNTLLMGGAILGGAYFGDRCSPMSTSALLVSQLTGTDLYRNLVNMVRTSLWPFALSCGLYLALGQGGDSAHILPAIGPLFRDNFNLHPVVALPALLIVGLCALRVKVRHAMMASIAAACTISLFLQHTAPAHLLRLLLFGFAPQDEQLSAMMAGGGILSMGNVVVIVCLSAAYAGIFEGTGLLDGVKAQVARLGDRLSPYAAVLITAVVTCMVTCNQTLSIIITHQLCEGLEPDREKLAVYLENTAVIIPPLVPWSVASVVTLSAIGAPATCALAAFYLYLLPLWQLIPNRTRCRETDPHGEAAKP